jgi:hypothetical protein
MWALLHEGSAHTCVVAHSISRPNLDIAPTEEESELQLNPGFIVQEYPATVQVPNNRLIYVLAYFMLGSFGTEEITFACLETLDCSTCRFKGR